MSGEAMRIAVVGLGLIGGSLCKAVKRHTRHICIGWDTDEAVLARALDERAIDEAAGPVDLRGADITIVCLYPEQTVSFILENACAFAPGSVVMDVCGVKRYVADGVASALERRGVTFIGTHPMAGREVSGYAHSDAGLFKGASFIMTVLPGTDPEKARMIEALAMEIGFGNIVRTTPEAHDRIIAFTSQLAHVVSNAYVKSPALQDKDGFTAGSYGDLTRVARLHEGMWASLFLHNREPLLCELDNIIGNLGAYRDAIADGDEQRLRGLLREGRVLKENAR